jgi:hypothetical protein
MITSLEDARFFSQEIEKIVRGRQSGHDLVLIRRLFRAFLHCWRSVFYMLQNVKGFNNDKFGKWCDRWKEQNLDDSSIKLLNQLRDTRNYDTHSGTIVTATEVGLLTPLVFLNPVDPSYSRRELVHLMPGALIIIEKLVQTHAECS